MNELNRILLHLSLISRVGPSAVHKLLTALGPDGMSDLYSLKPSDLRSLGLSADLAEYMVVKLANIQLVEKEIALIERYGFSLVTIVDKNYPSLLREIHCPPTVLYVQGSTNFIKQSIAFVGARKANHYGKQIVDACVEPLITHGWHIISGGARGADTFAHQSTVDHGGITIAVLGSGLLHRYPRSNNKLFDSIIEQGGSLISSFPLQTEPSPITFPARNRIIAGMSKGCVVVQAAQKSGALITAKYALDEGREVFAIPGSVFDPLSAGCHSLLSQGASVATGPEDILKVFGYSHSATQQVLKQSSLLEIQRSQLSGNQRMIVEYLLMPKSVDDLAVATKLPHEQVTNELSELQLEGLVEQDFTGLWRQL